MGFQYEKTLVKSRENSTLSNLTWDHITKGENVNEIGLNKSELDTPVLWVDLDKLERNIEVLGAYFREAGVSWRPHTKGVKVPAIAHKAMAEGALGVTCAKLGEAEIMAAAGITDILIANQVVGPRKYLRLVNLCRRVDVKIAVDSDATLADLGQAAVEKRVEVGILIELNNGMNRAGVSPGAQAVVLARKVHETPGLRFYGLGRARLCGRGSRLEKRRDYTRCG